jgi:Fe2+ or Zn2+ uptake regulation protein
MYIINETHFHLQAMPLSSKILARLKKHGYKATPQRLALLRAITGSREHLTPVAIYNKARQEQPGIGLVTVYRTLNILAHLGLICEVKSAGENTRSYVASPLEHHGHLICSGCGRVADFTGCNLHDLEQQLSHDTGFTIQDHRLEFFGYCQDCRKTASSEIPPPSPLSEAKKL